LDWSPGLGEPLPSAPTCATFWLLGDSGVLSLSDLTTSELPAPVGAEGRGSPSPSDQSSAIAEMQARLAELQGELSGVQGESPLVLATVGEQAVANVVSDWTGIPVGKMVSQQLQAVLELETTLASRVVGQDHAMRSIARRIQTARAGLDDPEKPVGVFLLAGPSGVGKTETAIALAETLYGGQQNLISINMSEFQESHTVSTLKGAPPGYVGYGEGGVLTEAVRRKPYSVLLLDEIEKAHPDTHEIFFQVFDKGRMEDGEGKSIDFKNTLILLTSNVGSDTIMRLCEAGQQRADLEMLSRGIRQDLTAVFPPALLGRMVIVPYYPLDDSNLEKIIQLKMDKIVRRVQTRYDATVIVHPDVLTLIGSRCTEVESGGRMIDAILTNSVMPEIGRRMLEHIAREQTVDRIEMTVNNGEIDYHVHFAS
ncbi:MAG: AAA family ATPase, partial [Planctomycetota bacterium]